MQAVSTPPRVAVIGAGFSGTITALHLLRTLPVDAGVLLTERAPSFAAGTAYGTPHPDHLLNVRAANMSAFGDRPDSFDAWLHSCAIDDTVRVHLTEVGAFASRALYGRYLASMLGQSLAGAAGATRLSLVRDEVIDVAREPAGGYVLHFAGGDTHSVAQVILAVGNLPSGDRATAVYRPNAWAADTLSGLTDDLPVLIVGTGLTTADLVVTLHEAGFPGPVIAVSRRGLLPREHAPAGVWPRPGFSPAERASLPTLLRRVRREIRLAENHGVNWRAVIDSMRPDTAELWRGLTDRDRARFLRHLRPFWDVHRHRLAPPSAALLRRLRDSGYLRIVRGRMTGVDEAQGAATVQLRSRDGMQETLRVQRIISATGVESASRCGDRLLTNLLARGLVRLDPNGLGIAVTEALQVVAADGRAAADLWALGPIVRGMFWECTAVPDIRVQAQMLATQVARV